MSIDWHGYLIICMLSLFIAAGIIGTRYLHNIRHFGLVYLLLMAVTYIVRPYLSYTFGSGMTYLEIYLPGTSNMIQQDALLLAIVFSVSIISFSIGYRIIKRPTINDIKEIDKNKIAIFTKFAILLIIIGYASFLVARRGFLSSKDIEYLRYTGGVVYGNTTGYIELANYFVVAGSLLYFSATKKLATTILLVLPWFINQIYDGYSRYMYLNLAIGLAIVGLLSISKHKKRDLGRFVITMFLAFSALLLLLSMRGYRDFFRSGGTIFDAVQATNTLPLDQKLGDFAGFEGTWYLIHTYDYISPKYGAGIFYQNFVLPIPRLLWINKPLKVEFTWGTLVNGINLSFSKWRRGLTSAKDFLWYNTAVKGSIGDAIEEWGWAGLIINFVLTGIFFAWIEKRFANSDFSPAWLASYAVAYAFIAMQGRNSIFEYLIIYLLIFFIPYYFFQRFYQAFLRRKLVEGSGLYLEKVV